MKDALLDLVADAKKFEEIVDGDADDHGRPQISVSYDIDIDEGLLRALVEAAGIKIPYGKSPLDAIWAELR